MQSEKIVKTEDPGIFLSTHSGKPLSLSENPKTLYNDEEKYVSQDDVLILLDKQNSDYEGIYLGKVKYIPRKDRIPYTFALWMMVNGFIWEVRKQFPKGALICELGCASGVNYFGNRYTMIGIDLSLKSLKGIENYKYRIQANALKLPFKNGSLDGIISSYFWEHIDPQDKVILLQEFYRVLKPGGKVVMLYDVVTENRLINLLKKDNLDLYEDLFLKGDYHIGYETLDENYKKFEQGLFKIKKHFGMERTFLQSTSVYIKLSTLPTLYGKYSQFMKWLNSSRIIAYFNILTLRIIDETIGAFVNKKRSRITLSVLEKE